MIKARPFNKLIQLSNPIDLNHDIVGRVHH